MTDRESTNGAPDGPVEPVVQGDDLVDYAPEFEYSSVEASSPYTPEFEYDSVEVDDICAPKAR